MPKILIVEDDPKIADLLLSAIEKYGYEGAGSKIFVRCYKNLNR